ncbi:MAG: NAD(P)/FAD-dependent oxidoreductase [Patescibacteria group bacterium]
MIYDLAIIGAGPAGLMAANRAGELGAKVIIIEKNRQPGIKLLLSGNGRCNLTNKIDNHRILADCYGNNGKFLLSGFSQFDAADAIAFFAARGVKTKVEDNNRVLPQSDQARDILKALLADLKKYQIKIKTDSAVKKIVAQNNKIQKIILAKGEEITAKNYLLATGGKSYPLTGSTGEAYAWLQKLGHTIIEPRPALTPIVLQERTNKSLEGVSFKKIKLTVKQNNRLIAQENGDIIFTANGISGPAAINLSRLITDRLSSDTAIIVDFFPSKTESQIDTNLRELWQAQKNKTIKNSLTVLAPTKLIDVALKSAGIDPDKQANVVTRAERKSLVSSFKGLKAAINRLEGYDRAIITKGGVKINEIDPKTMRSKIIANLYLAGEILDLDGPTGGFNLQICWTTGYVAGDNAA